MVALEAQLKILENLWKVPEKFNRNYVYLDLMVRRNLGLPNSGPFDVFKFAELLEKECWFKTKCLLLKYASEGLINNPQYELDDYNWKRFKCVFQRQYWACNMVYCAQKYELANDDENAMDAPSQSFGLLMFSTQLDGEKLNHFQEALILILKRLGTEGVRKFEKDVYRPLFTEPITTMTRDGQPQEKMYYTYAWTKLMSIEEYVQNTFNLDTNLEEWLKTAKYASMPSDIASYLTHYNTAYFPELVKNRYLFSYRNGLYFTRRDMFVKYTDIVGLQTVGNLMDTMPRNPKLGDIYPKHQAAIFCSCKYFDAEFQDWKDRSQFIDANGNKIPRGKPRDILNLEAQMKSSPVGAVVEIPQRIKDWEAAQEKRNWKSAQWTDIPTPALESILDAQGFHRKIKWWIYVLIGMSLYYGGELENWQISVLILGYAGTGKSTLLRIIREFYELEQVGILSNNIERQWALSTIYNRYVVLGYEVKKDFKWEQGEFQNAVTHEEVLVMVNIKKFTFSKNLG
jgi:hypothetical protein